MPIRPTVQRAFCADHTGLSARLAAWRFQGAFQHVAHSWPGGCARLEAHSSIVLFRFGAPNPRNSRAAGLPAASPANNERLRRKASARPIHATRAPPACRQRRPPAMKGSDARAHARPAPGATLYPLALLSDLAATPFDKLLAWICSCAVRGALSGRPPVFAFPIRAGPGRVCPACVRARCAANTGCG